MIAKRLIVRGRVQGVFYRDWTVETVGKLSVTGWVRNRDDGTVEAHVEGEPPLVERMIEHMHSGPPMARVERIESRSTENECFTSFERR